MNFTTVILRNPFALAGGGARQPPLRCGVSRKCSLFFSYGSCNVAWKTWTQKIYKKTGRLHNHHWSKKVFIRKVRWPFLRNQHWRRRFNTLAPQLCKIFCAKWERKCCEHVTSERERHERIKNAMLFPCRSSVECREAGWKEGETSQLPPLSPSQPPARASAFSPAHSASHCKS